jgi:hypothetical protein
MTALVAAVAWIPLAAAILVVAIVGLIRTRRRTVNS